MLAVRAVAAFLLLPGVVAGVVPWLLRPAAVPFYGDAAMAMIPGATLLGWCVRDFYVTGRGTLAPWSAPRRLVRTGPYRCSRNPMYVAVTLVLAGWAIAYRSIDLAIYAAIVVAAFNLRVVFREEPELERAFGDEWTAYRARVRRWL